MDRQYPRNIDQIPGISEHSFNISGISFLVILSDEEYPLALSFWTYETGRECSICYHYETLPVGRNYVCLCNIESDSCNRLFLTVTRHNKHAKVVATTELNREDKIGLLLHIVPIPHASLSVAGLYTTRITTLQFLCAGHLTLQESDQIKHITTRNFKTKTYQDTKWFDMFMDNWTGQTCSCNGQSMKHILP